jgi:hypothetical protein
MKHWLNIFLPSFADMFRTMLFFLILLLSALGTLANEKRGGQIFRTLAFKWKEDN